MSARSLAATAVFLVAATSAGWFDGESGSQRQQQQQQQQQQQRQQQQQQQRDLYAVLGVDESATDAEIKKAYRRLSVKHHPDKGGDAAAFKELTSAYEVLSDGERRALYDVGGMSAVEKGAGGRDMFGRSTGVPKGALVEVTVRAPLEDFYKGGTVRANVRRRVVCRSCRGHEAHPRCSGCSRSCPAETKVVQRRMGPMLINEEVQVPSEQLCREGVKTLHAVIERGAEEDTAVTFERSSEQSPGEVPGDVLLRLRSEGHAAFTRRGADLEMDLRISLRQALLGFKRRIRHLDGHEVLISHAAVSTPGMVLTFANEGMPRHGVPSEYGALRVTLQIDFPSELTADERAFTANHFGLPADGGQR